MHILKTTFERQLDKFIVTIDNSIHTTEQAAMEHIKIHHKRCIEKLLRFFLEDMEQDQLGFFFTKLFCADFLYPPIPAQNNLKNNNNSIPNDYPSVKAPFFSRK